MSFRDLLPNETDEPKSRYWLIGLSADLRRTMKVSPGQALEGGQKSGKKKEASGISVGLLSPFTAL